MLVKLGQLMAAHREQDLEVLKWVHETVQENEDKGAKYSVEGDDGRFVSVVHPSDRAREKKQ
jgi:hypothetical protein